MVTEIHLDKPRNVRFDWIALKDLETRLNGEPIALMVRKMEQLSPNTISAALYAGLKHEDPELTQQLLDRILQTYFANGGTMQAVLKALNAALLDSGVIKTTSDQPAPRGNVGAAATVP